MINQHKEDEFGFYADIAIQAAKTKIAEPEKNIVHILEGICYNKAHQAFVDTPEDDQFDSMDDILKLQSELISNTIMYYGSTLSNS